MLKGTLYSDKQNNYMKRHPIIAIEGIDGSGKTTIAKILSKELGMLYLKTPDKPFSFIRKYFDQKSTDARARMHFYIGCLWDAYLKAARESNYQGVILDRYILSTAAYHSVLCGKSYDAKKIIELTSPPSADLNIFLKTDIYTSQKRILERCTENCDSALEKDIKFQEKVSAVLEQLADITISNENREISDTAGECKYFINELIRDHNYKNYEKYEYYEK